MGLVCRLKHRLKHAADYAFIFLKWGAGPRNVHRVVGESMEPTFHKGDLVFTRPLRFEDLAPGDVVVIKRDMNNWIKRVSSKADNSFAISSDNPYEAIDSRHVGSLSEQDLVGKAFAVFTRTGQLNTL